MMAVQAFVTAVPARVAPALDAGAIHVWRMPYARAFGREPLCGLLGAYLGVPASKVALQTGAHGKPFLAEGASVSQRARQALHFNWSHSGEYALVAIARGIELGVDIERVDARRRGLEIARRFFTPAEARQLERVDGTQRAETFTALWCAKEAVLKAAGEGLAFGLNRVACTREDDATWRLSGLDAALGSERLWQLRGFAAAPGYRGALAWHGAAAAHVLRIDAFRMSRGADAGAGHALELDAGSAV